MAQDPYLRDRQISQGVLVLSALLAIVWSFSDPSQALYALALNALSPLLARWRKLRLSGRD
jgi:hypothetical protein